jgi:hypothetical protein
MITSVLIGAVLAACGLAFVLTPLLFGSTPGARPVAGNGAALSQRIGRSGNGSDTEATAVDVLREIEFDRATGKLSDADYGSLKSTYTARALEELRSPDRRESSGPAAAESSRSPAATPSSCPSCHHRTVAGAAYCLNCGHYLTERCPCCGAAITMAAARYCGACGGALGATAGAARPSE